MSKIVFEPTDKIAIDTDSDSGTDLAVIGIDCSFPGASNWRIFWKRLCEKYIGISQTPRERYRFFKRVQDGSDISPWLCRGGYLEEPFNFDAPFFSISPRESELMDPQQRLLLQSTWGAVEDAGYRMGDFSQRFRVGTFVGLSALDFTWLVATYKLPPAPQLLTGGASSIAANRIAFIFDFKGPSEIVDTACSSALVALHRARQAISAGECDCAVVAACNLLLSPSVYISFGQAGMLSTEGLCRTFDHQASGYVRGEGVGAVIVKSKARAIADKDKIYGVISGTAVNHNGRSRTLTSPSAFAQADVIRKAQTAAGVSANTISYIEAHGTATPKGDPVEILGLKRAFGCKSGNKSGVRCGIGAVKTNIGHLEPAAGLAGLIKVLLSLRHRTLPGLVNFERLNPKIALDGTQFYLVEDTIAWETPVWQGERLPRRAGVSSFGFGGANAHAVVEEYQREAVTEAPALGKSTAYVLPLSATSVAALRAIALKLVDFLGSHEAAGLPLSDVAFTLQQGREPFRERLAVVVAQAEAAADALRDITSTLEAGGSRLRVAIADTHQQSDKVAMQLASNWLSGQVVDWSMRGGASGRRISLPTYEFAKTAYTAFNQMPVTHTALHTWLDENVSSFGRQCFRKRLDPDQAPLSMYVNDRNTRLPEGAALEMLYQAAVLSLRHAQLIGLESVESLRPLALEKAIDVFVEFSSNGAGYTCRLVSAAEGDVTVFVQAAVLVGRTADRPILQNTSGDAQLTAQPVSGEADEQFEFLLPVHERNAALAIPVSLFDKVLARASGVMHSATQSSMFERVAEMRVLGAAPSRGIVLLSRHSVGQSPNDRWNVSCCDERRRPWLEMRGLSFAVPADVSGADQRSGSEKLHKVLGVVDMDSSQVSLRQRLLSHLVEVIATVTKFPVEQIDPGQTFDRFGLDSALIVEATQAVEKVCGPVSQTLLFEYSSLDSLADYLLAHHAVAIEAYFVQDNSVELSLADSLGAAQPTPQSLDEPVHPNADAMQASPQVSVVSPQTKADLRHEPIAIVGIAGRYAHSETLEDFWRNLSLGLDLVTTIPPGRWSIDEYFDAKKGISGKTYCKWGSFIDEPARFETALFNISPTEARVLDPQERQFLEIAWATLEDAGYAPSDLAGAPVGVFVGAMWSQYQMVEPNAGSEWLPSSSFASIANRVSYMFDLYGPSMAVDTMCASSLTSIHLACRSLRNGECTMALAGGVNLSPHVNKYQQLAQSRFLASDGRCKSFGKGGDGYVPGEGVGAVLLKPLAQALQDGDFIHALIRGSAINHGGRNHGYTVPNPRAQTMVVRAALADAHLAPAQIDYIEAHGTGTSLGDPIEISGLREVFSAERAVKAALPIGSVKSNLGHLESAAGIAGLSKVLLQLRHRQLAPSIHSETLNPAIDFSVAGFQVQQQLAPWPARPSHAETGPQPRRAGISSFGAGGANAHVVVEEWLLEPRSGASAYGNLSSALWLPISALRRKQLLRRARDLADFMRQRWPALRDSHGLTVLDIAWTLQSGRDHLPYRGGLFASSEAELLEGLQAIADEQPHPATLVATQPLANRVNRKLNLAADSHSDPQAMAAAWLAGQGEGPRLSLPQGNQPRRVPLPGLRFMGEVHWIGDAPATRKPTHPAQGHTLFQNLTVVRS